jgi:hypothetical protein
MSPDDFPPTAPMRGSDSSGLTARPSASGRHRRYQGTIESKRVQKFNDHSMTLRRNNAPSATSLLDLREFVLIEVR